MHLKSILAVLFFVIRCAIGQNSSTPVATAQPPDFSGEDTPYQVTPTGADIHLEPLVNVGTQNRVGTWLYGYNGCKKVPGAKGKIDGVYYDAWVMTITQGVASDIDWNNAAALEFLGAPGLNKAKQPQIQAVLANTATIFYIRTISSSTILKFDAMIHTIAARTGQNRTLAN